MSDLEQLNHVEKPWGSYDVVFRDEKLRVKCLKIKPGNRLSDQKHKHRSEHWFVSAGAGEVYLEYPDGSKEVKKINVDDSVTFDAGVWHRLVVPEGEQSDLHIVEVWSGDVLDEDDIERRSDDYGRA